MHTFGMPTAFMKFNYVYILPRRAETCPLFLFLFFFRLLLPLLALLSMQIEWIPASDSTEFFCFGRSLENNFIFCAPSSRREKAASSHKQQRETVFSYRMCYVVQVKKNIREETIFARRSRAEGRGDYYCCLP